MLVTGTYFNYYQVCHRKLWLFSMGISMEQNSELVYAGKLIHKESYPQRPERYEEVELGGIKVDYYDAKRKVIHEIKRSNKVEKAHEWQLKYYLYVFERNGIKGVSGILEYPKMRKNSEIILSDKDRELISEMEVRIQEIIKLEKCPPIEKKGICRSCSYYDFCFVGEDVL